MDNRYPQQKLGFIAPGSYVGYVGVSGSGNKHSAAAWACHPSDSQELMIEDAAPSESNSTVNRAALRAVLRLIELTPRQSSLRAYCTVQFIVNGLNKDLPIWKRRGWRSSGGQLANADLWQRIDYELNEKAVTIEASDAAPGSPEARIIERLQSRAALLRGEAQGRRDAAE